MSAFLCSDTRTTRLELRSTALTLIAVSLKTPDLDALADELAQHAVTVGRFDDEPVAINLLSVREAEDAIDFEALIALLRRHGMRPMAARGGNPAQMSAARAAGLLEVPEGLRPPLREVAPPPEIVERTVEVQLPPLAPLVIDKPLRSGQQVYARERDLIVLALVSFGAEVMADGHIHLYAPMRGRAHAGASGNVDARIFCHRMEAQMLAIAGVYRTMDDSPAEHLAGRAAMVRLAGDHLAIDPLG